MTTNNKVAIYARVNQQQEGLDNQLQALRAYCEANGKEISAEYVDEGVSGMSMEGRHSLQRLLEDAEKQEFHEVLIWKIDQLAENVLDVMRIIRKLEERNVTFRSITANYENNSPTGKFIFKTIALITELNLKENMLENQQ